MALSEEEIRPLLHFDYKMAVNASKALDKSIRRMVTKFVIFAQLSVCSRHSVKKEVEVD
ncbi:hypothetical protein KIN20_015430 [Parelaphostrongylus tenuis]|uniref:Uncharacterized protein n=1 Tax=Parelaphostrongylus tenuis TaxID=148309 RepID=A0AAD5N0L8_PARTN|nr:hypothetical protein KIN20_015430 [Parelaphostrongylus tenuis]